MIAEPEKGIERWLVPPVRRIIVHIETLPDVQLFITKCHTAGIEIGLAVSPGVMWESLLPWLSKVDMVQVLAVAPGPSGQEMAPDTYEKIRRIRGACPSCIIEVDGGMNPETARLAREAGVNLIASGAYIFSSPDIGDAIGGLLK